MKILITGAAGYIAKSIYSKLSGVHTFVLAEKESLNLLDSVKVTNFFKYNTFDVVIHCAVVGGSRLKKDNWDVLDQNLTMYYNLFNCKSSYKKMIHFGSGAELYAENTPYGYSKSIIRKSVLNNPGFYNIRIYGVFDENELATRFIKTNVSNYINKKSIVIHQDRKMDFFYMEDFISLVDYYLRQDNLPKEIDCTYNETKSLLEISQIINNLSNYKVDVVLQESGMSQYFGNYTPLPIEYIGLINGIKKVYNKIK